MESHKIADVLSRQWRAVRAWLRPPRRLSFEREGRIFVGVVLALGVAAVNTGNNLLYLLVAWMLAVIVASGALSERNLRGLRVERRRRRAAFVGRECEIEVRLHNRKVWLPSFGVEVSELAPEAAGATARFFHVPAGETRTGHCSFVPGRRGRYVLPTFRLATRFPFGLFRKSRDIERPFELIVYPRVEPMSVAAAWQRGGESVSACRPGGQGELYGLHEYRAGDDRRHIHWRASARHQKLLVREHEQESTERVTLLVDNAVRDESPPARLRVERDISRAASLATAYVRRGWQVGVIARGEAVPPAAGNHHLQRILHVLALLPVVSSDVPFARRPPAGRRGTIEVSSLARPSHRIS